MYEDLFKAFDAWEELYKARKAKGLDNWARLSHLATKLAGKHGRDISYTCSHPKHGGSGDKHNLGSTEGNLHFLLGYGNPGFHLAPYHWQIIYPDLSEDEAVSFAAQQGHPAQQRLWEQANLDVSDEGDLEEGKAHPFASHAKRVKEVSERSIPCKSTYGKYTADPVTGLVSEASTARVYSWNLIQNSYFAYENPEVAAAMDAANPQVKKSLKLPEIVRHMMEPGEWDQNVYPMVKSLFPKPGSVVTLPAGDETVYGIVKSDTIQLVDAAGQPVEFEQYDRSYGSLDLLKGGDIHPSILFNFAKTYMNVDTEHLTSFLKSQDVPAPDDFPSVVVGFPSPGFDHVPAGYSEDLKKSVVFEDGTYRLKIED